MKKIDTSKLEKMAKQKNIDKNKIEEIASGYQGKSENELLDELIKIGKTLEGKEEVVSKFKAFLDDNQKKKLDNIMGKIAQAEANNKVESKKGKKSKVNANEMINSNSSIAPKKVKKVKKVKKG